MRGQKLRASSDLIGKTTSSARTLKATHTRERQCYFLLHQDQLVRWLLRPMHVLNSVPCTYLILGTAEKMEHSAGFEFPFQFQSAVHLSNHVSTIYVISFIHRTSFIIQHFINSLGVHQQSIDSSSFIISSWIIIHHPFCCCQHVTLHFT